MQNPQSSHSSTTTTTNATTRIIKRRQGIDNITRLKICQFVASQSPPPSTKELRQWALATFGRSFPQSTLSTLLRNNGLQIKQAGGRGRKCRPDSHTLQTGKRCRPSLDQVSTRTNLFISQLKMLADSRFRGRSSDYPEIELMFLEETYLKMKDNILSPEYIANTLLPWFQKLAKRLFSDHTASIKSEFPKNISQFLNQMYDKYYLTNTIYQYFELNLEYNLMSEKLTGVFPELKGSFPVDLANDTDSIASTGVSSRFSSYSDIMIKAASLAAANNTSSNPDLVIPTTSLSFCKESRGLKIDTSLSAVDSPRFVLSPGADSYFKSPSPFSDGAVSMFSDNAEADLHAEDALFWENDNDFFSFTQVKSPLQLVPLPPTNQSYCHIPVTDNANCYSPNLGLDELNSNITEAAVASSMGNKFPCLPDTLDSPYNEPTGYVSLFSHF
jgi:hypothetical protein